MSKLALIKKWVLRYIKYNIIGTSIFLISLALYYLLLFPAFGEQAYIVVSILGGIIQFSLISYFNRTKRGIMFDSCRPLDVNKPNQTTDNSLQKS